MSVAMSRTQLISLNLPSLELLRNVPEGPERTVRFGTHLGSFVNEPTALGLEACGGTLVFRPEHGTTPFTTRFGHPMEAACTTCAFRVPLDPPDRHGWEAAVTQWMRTAHSFGLYFAVRNGIGSSALREICMKDSAWFSLRSLMPIRGTIFNTNVLRTHVPKAQDPALDPIVPFLETGIAVASMPELDTPAGAVALAGIATILPHYHPPAAVSPRERRDTASVRALFGLSPETTKNPDAMSALTSLKAFTPQGTYREN